MKKKILVIGSVFISLLLIISVLLQWKTFTINPFDRAMPLENPLIATMDNHNHIYVIDKSMKRIVKMDVSGNVLFTITGGERSRKAFFYAQELVADDSGNLYLLNEVLDETGQYVEREDILKYRPNGELDSLIYTVAYKDGDRPLRKGRLCSLSVSGGFVYCYNKMSDSFSLIRLSLSDHTASTAYSVDFSDANNLIVDFATTFNPMYSIFTTKKGEMYKADSVNKPALIYPTARQFPGEGAISIPWEVESGKDGAIYFTDLGQKQIREFDRNGKIKTLLSDEIIQKKGYGKLNLLVYRISANSQGKIASVFNGFVICTDNNSKIIAWTGCGKIPLAAFIFRFFAWGQLLLLAILLFRLATLFYSKVLRGNISASFLHSVYLIAAVVICSLFLSNMILNNYNGRYKDEVMGNISQTIQLVSKAMDGDALNRITKPQDFMNTDYRKLRDTLHSSFNNNSDSWNQGFYGAIYKVSSGQLNGIVYYDDSICPYYPIALEGTDNEYLSAYRSGKITTRMTSDADGDWMYGVGPIYDSNGKITGVLEIGTDLYGFQQENSRLESNLIIDIITILVVILLVLIEITLFTNINYERRRKESGLLQPTAAVSSLEATSIRPLCFIIYASGFMSQAFIPLLMKKLYVPSLGLPKNIVIGLPLSIEALFIAISAVIGGYLVDKKGWKPLFTTGLAIMAGGQFLSALAGNAPVFILARMICGMGFGLALISMQSFVIMPSDEEGKNAGISALNSGAYAGINCGVVIGAMLAARAGFSNVFFIAAFLALIAFVAGLKFMKNHIRVKTGTVMNGEQNSFKMLAGFLFDRQVITFFLLMLIPVTISLAFLEYFFPLFAQSQGLTTDNIGRAFLVNGLCVVYLGPLLSKYLAKYIGTRLSLLFSCLIISAAIIQFALQGTLVSAIVAVIMIGIGESFGITSKITYFSSLPPVTDIGEGKAVGFYSLVENLGQILGPLVYGLLISLGIMKGIGSIGIGFLILLAVFSLITIKMGIHRGKKYLSM